MAVYIGTVPPKGWEQIWDKAAARAGYTGPRPSVITDSAELARHGADIGALVTKTVSAELLAAVSRRAGEGADVVPAAALHRGDEVGKGVEHVRTNR